MGVVERFAELVRRPAADVDLDGAVALIAAHVRDDRSALAVGRALDDLAAACPDATFDGLRHHLFVAEGFRGDERTYGDPANSFLDRVVARRLGIPITLAIVMIGVGRRIGVGVVPIGMPGHFLVRDPHDGAHFCDPFAGGRVLDVDGCRQVFRRVHGDARGFELSMLAPTAPSAVIARVLANLEHGPLGRQPRERARLLELHARVPGLGAAERLALAHALRRTGRLTEAAQTFEALAVEATSPDERDELLRHARRLRAMGN